MAKMSTHSAKPTTVLGSRSARRSRRWFIDRSLLAADRPAPAILCRAVDAYDAIVTRRSIGAVTDRRPDRADVEALLEAAVRAPTHHLTEPWRFIVLAGSAHSELGAVMGRRVRAEMAGDPHVEERVRFEEARPLRAPVVLTVVYRKSDNPKAVEVEDRYAVGAALQNILLAAHARG